MGLAKKLEREKEKELEELKQFFDDIDADESGTLTLEELMWAAKHEAKVRTRLQSLDIMPRDLTELWDILDDGDGELDVQEFVNGIRRLRGEARAKDILRLYRELKILETQTDQIEHCLVTSRERRARIQRNVQRARGDIAAFSR